MSLMNYSLFQIGFWHPFGPHGRESVDEILERKRREIRENGWTLWSFQRRRVLDDWRHEILTASPDAVYVFCSEGVGATDPPNEPVACRSYRLISDAGWQPLPKAIRVPHPFRHGCNEASAFVVQGVVYPVDSFELPTVEWFSLKRGPWRRETVPTRGEYLIKAGGSERMRRCRAVLILQDPYLAMVSTKEV
jgi:hypothetical protein